MGMWDWLEEQYPAPGSRSAANGFPPLAASDASALLKLIERGVAARGQTDDDDASAAQSARETAAATVAREVKPPYVRHEGDLTHAPHYLVPPTFPQPTRRFPPLPPPPRPPHP